MVSGLQRRSNQWPTWVPIALRDAPWIAGRRRRGGFPMSVPTNSSQVDRPAQLEPDDPRGYVTDHLGHPDAVLVVDETGDVRRGNQTVGVQRQYTGTAGRVENAQVAVYLAYAAPAGHTLIDRALYLPQGWVDDPDRCAAAGIPTDVGFATKPALATGMITAALDAGVTARWVAGDEVYGADPTLHRPLRTGKSAACWPSPAAGASRSARAGGGSMT